MINFIKIAEVGNIKFIQVGEGDVLRSPCIIEANYINFF